MYSRNCWPIIIVLDSHITDIARDIATFIKLYSSVISKYFKRIVDQDGCYFANDMFKCIFLYENCCILIPISLTFVPNVPIDNTSFSIGLDNGLVTIKEQAVIWTDDCIVHWRMYASPGLNELSGFWIEAILVKARARLVRAIMR